MGEMELINLDRASGALEVLCLVYTSEVLLSNFSQLILLISSSSIESDLCRKGDSTLGVCRDMSELTLCSLT